MRSLALPIHHGLAHSTRLPALVQPTDHLQIAEIAWLVGAGVAATSASAFLEFGLRIPGHAIIRAVFPMALGLAVAPRHMAGTVMGTGALASALMIQMAGIGRVGFGALTSLVLIGPLLDVALWRAQRGWRLYLGFALAGLAGNLAALAVRAGVKLTGLEPLGKRPFAEWLPQAVLTYTVCGILAGLLSAWICFRFAEGGQQGREEAQR